MEFRDIVLWLGLIAIVVILWDGFRRMKSLGKPKATKRVEEPYIDPEEAAKQAEIARELPNGGARKREMTEEERRHIASRLNLRERVPMLMERVDVAPPAAEEPQANVVQSELDFTAAMAEQEKEPFNSVDDRHASEVEPDISAFDDSAEIKSSSPENDKDSRHISDESIENDLLDQEEDQHLTEQNRAAEHTEIEDDPDYDDEDGVLYVDSVEDDEDDDIVADIYSKGAEPKPDAPVAVAPKAKPSAKVESVQSEANEPDVQNEPKAQEPKSDAQQASQGPVEELVIMHVMAPDDGELSGSAVLNLLLTAGLRHGPMEIFHYRNPQGYTEFSLANCVHPGTFNPDSMNQVNTPGVTLFMQLPTGADTLEAFDHMHQMAVYLAKNLDAVILDEDHNKVTNQRLEYYREHLRAYSRSKLIRS